MRCTSSFALPIMTFRFWSLCTMSMSFYTKVRVQVMVGIFGFSLEGFGGILDCIKLKWAYERVWLMSVCWRWWPHRMKVPASTQCDHMWPMTNRSCSSTLTTPTAIGAMPPFKLCFGVEASEQLKRWRDSLHLVWSLITMKWEALSMHSTSKLRIRQRQPSKVDIHCWVIKCNGYYLWPYWVSVTFGPFTEDQLTVCAHKKESPSGDWWAQVILN